MGNFLYLVAILFFIAWLTGMFIFHKGSIIHILLIMALLAVFIRSMEKQNMHHK
jgi:hypothetical protein